MLEKELVTYQGEIVVSKICDRCGRVAKDTVEDIIEWQEFISIYIEGGYGSIFGDGNISTCDLCQHCVGELFGGYLRLRELD